MYQGNLGSINVVEKPVIAAGHDAVVVSLRIKGNQGVQPKGKVMELDVNKELVPYDPDAETPAETLFVINEQVDTTKAHTAATIVHGTVKKDNLLVGNAAPDAADVIALIKSGIYPI